MIIISIKFQVKFLTKTKRNSLELREKRTKLKRAIFVSDMDLQYENKSLLDEFATSSDDLSGYTPYHLRPETYIVPVLFFLIFIVGVLGNGTLVIIFLRHRAMRNVPNT